MLAEVDRGELEQLLIECPQNENRGYENFLAKRGIAQDQRALKSLQSDHQISFKKFKNMSEEERRELGAKGLRFAFNCTPLRPPPSMQASS